MLALQYDVVVVLFVVVVIVSIRASGGTRSSTCGDASQREKSLLRDFPPNASYDYRVKLKLIKPIPKNQRLLGNDWPTVVCILERINTFATTTVKALLETTMISTIKNVMGRRLMTTAMITITIASNYVIPIVFYI